MKTMMQTQF